jgi:putative protease
MATRRKAKGKAKTARKNEARRKKMRAGKGARGKSVKKVRTVRKTQAKKAPLRPASRKTARPSKPKTSPISGRAPEAVRPAPSRLAKPASSEQRIGVVTHYYSHLSVAVMQLEPGATLRVGDVIHIWGHTTDFTQKVESLEVDHASVAEVGPKDDFGLKVIEHAREHDVVFKVRS